MHLSCSTTKGLSISDKLVISPTDDDAVVVLFKLEAKEEGHWLIPNPDLPSTVNGEDVFCPVLLSQGKIITQHSSCFFPRR
jgi:hypothetical protein